MNRKEDIRFSRQGLLRSERSERSESTSPSPSRRPQSTDSELSDGSDSDLDFAVEKKPSRPYQDGRTWPWIPTFQRVISFGSSRTPSQQNPPPKAYSSRTTRIKSWCWSHRICLIITAILLGGFLTLLTGGAFWIWKTAAKDGVGLCKPSCSCPKLILPCSSHHHGTLRPKAAHTRYGPTASRRRKQWSTG